MQGEWAWFRQSVVVALFYPRTFARSLAREHYGLAGVLVAFASGFALSASIDAAVILSKGADPLALWIRIVTDAFLLALRFAVVVAIVALISLVIARLRRRALSLDQSFTALAFASAPLVFGLAIPLLLALSSELRGTASDVALAAAGLGLAALTVRLVYGAVVNLAALVGLSAAPSVAIIAIAAFAIILQDQVGRVVFTTLTYAPGILAAPAPVAARGEVAEVDGGVRLQLPAEWKNASRGIPGEALHYETPDAVVTVRFTTVSLTATADAVAGNAVRDELRDYTRVESARRTIVRVDDVAAIDDEWRGWIGGVRLVQRLYTFVIGTRGYLIEFRFFHPSDEGAALDGAASIAASITIAR